MELVLAENKKYIYISIDPKNDRPLSWEEVQEIKDKFCPNLSFIEIYPERHNIINKANIRHLFHIKCGFKVPKFSDLEDETFKIQTHII